MENNIAVSDGAQPVALLQTAQASLVPEQKKLTPTEIKALYRMYFTVRHQNVEVCGHQFDFAAEQPRHANCETCWFTFFQVHGELTQTADEIFQKEGQQVLVAMKGKKFVKMFLKFMATVAQMVKEKNEQSVAGVGSGTTDEQNSSAGVSESGGTDSASYTSGQMESDRSSYEGAEQTV